VIIPVPKSPNLKKEITQDVKHVIQARTEARELLKKVKYRIGKL
jgi:hypothetical protein